MKEAQLPTLAIKILLKCNEKPISMHDVTQLYKAYNKEERDNVLNDLISNNYLEERKMPKPNAKKTPTYYLITNKGKNWVENYLKIFQ